MSAIVKRAPPGPLRAAVRVGREQFEPPATIQLGKGRRTLESLAAQTVNAVRDTIGTLVRLVIDIIILFSLWHCYGGAPRGERPASWDAPRLTRADPSRLANATTEIVRLSALRPPLQWGMDAITRTPPGRNNAPGNEQHCAV